MNKALLAIIPIVVVGIIATYAISPYFTESTIDETLPSGTIIQRNMEKEIASIIMEEEKMAPISYTATFVGVGDGIHDAQGDVYTIPLENGGNVLRLENFESTNGPDLYVYLSTDKGASDYIDLGKLKANNGNQNYHIPNDADLGKYGKVLIWCKAFGVLFGSAELSPN